MPYNKEELLNLPIEEKLELVEALWERIDDEFLGRKLSKNDLKKELNKRIKNMDKHPESLIPWEEVKKKMKTD